MGRVNWNAYDREVEQLEHDLDEGSISSEDYWAGMRDLNDEVRGAAEEAAEEAYRDTVGHW